MTISPHMSNDCQRCEDHEEWGAMPLYRELEMYGDIEEICEDCAREIIGAVESAYWDNKIDEARGN